MQSYKLWKENTETDQMYVNSLKQQISRLMDWMMVNHLGESQHEVLRQLQKALAAVDDGNIANQQ